MQMGSQTGVRLCTYAKFKMICSVSFATVSETELLK